MKQLAWIVPVLFIALGLGLNFAQADTEGKKGVILKTGESVSIRGQGCALTLLVNSPARIHVRCALLAETLDTAEAGDPLVVLLEPNQRYRVRREGCNLEITKQSPHRIDILCQAPPTRTPTPTPSITPPRACGGLPYIEFTYVPPRNSFEDVRGTTHCTEPPQYRVAVYINVPGHGWFNKPYWSAPLTTIGSDGTWVTDITTGGVDETANKICAFRVPSNYAPPILDGAPSLPGALFSFANACPSR